MKPSLQLRLSQHVALTPQWQQSIRLLQLSTIELEHELERYLQENPLLEREEEYPFPTTMSTDGEQEVVTEASVGETPGERTASDEESWLQDQPVANG